MPDDGREVGRGQRGGVPGGGRSLRSLLWQALNGLREGLGMRRLPQTSRWAVPESARATEKADADAEAPRQVAPYLLMVAALGLLTVLMFWGFAHWMPLAGRSGRIKAGEALTQAVAALRAGDVKQAQALRAEAGRAGAMTLQGCYLDGLLVGRGGSPGPAVDRRVKAAEAGRGGVRALATLAGLRASKGDATGALEALEKAHAQRPGDLSLSMLWVGAMMDAQQFEQAISASSALEERHGPSAALSELRGRAYLALGKADRALEEFAGGLSRVPRSVSLHLGAGEALLRQGDAEGALRLAEAALRVDAGSADARYCRGVALEKLKELDRAKTAYREAIALRADHPGALNNLAYLLAGRKATAAEAVELAKRAYRTRPSPAVADTLGWAHVQAGDAHEGLPFLEAAARALPNEATIAAHLRAAREQIAAGRS